MKPLVKICGLKRPEDAALAVSLGATHVGAVRAQSSPRAVTIEEARAIFDAAGPRATKVLLFKGAEIETVVAEARAAGADCVQLYSARSEQVRRIASEGLGVLRVYDVVDSLPALESPPTGRTSALFDVGGGGSGRRFDWSLLGAEAPAFTFIAGGITPENVTELLGRRPYGIDLSSGVEIAPGVKDGEKLRRLFARVEELS
jgi:indole-3-glycerol phosphate synthase/phosphoribosylanthranilate isomerase